MSSADGGAPGHDEAVDRAADHALGVELQLEELVEQRTRAEVQHRPGDARAIQGEIDRLTDELAATAERIDGPTAPAPGAT